MMAIRVFPRIGSHLRTAIIAALTAVVLIVSVERPHAQVRGAALPRRPETVLSEPSEPLIIDTVRARGTDMWPIRVKGLKNTRISVQVDRTSDIECKLIDVDGKAVDLPQPFTDRCRFAWTPARTGAYNLQIRNLRRTSVGYAIVIR